MTVTSSDDGTQGNSGRCTITSLLIQGEWCDDEFQRLHQLTVNQP